MITVYGDSILDIYQFVKHIKKSPESSGNVYELLPKRLQYRLGGAAAVAAICKHLGISPLLMTRCGNDDVGGMLRSLLTKHEITHHLLEINKGSTSKLRYITQNRLAADRFDKSFYQVFDWDVPPDCVKTNGLLVISDYRGGLCHNVQPLMQSGAKCIIVDPAINRNWMEYKGADIIKCNRNEIQYQLDSFHLFSSEYFESYVKFARHLNCHLIITNGEHAIQICEPQHNEAYYLSVPKARPIDITGCGDTITAALACYLDKNGFTTTTILEGLKYAIPLAAKQTQSIGVNYESLIGTD